MNNSAQKKSLSPVGPAAMILVLSLILISGQEALAGNNAPGGFNREELKAISSLLRYHHVIGLSETRPDGHPKAMTLAVRVKAPRQVAFNVFEDPKKFHYLSTLFEEAVVRDDHQSSKAYTWASRHKLFSFVGMNAISLYPPRRVDVSIVKSSLGAGDFRFMFYEDGKDHTIMVLHGIVDIKSSEWLVRFIIGNSPAMRQAMNMAIGIVVIKGAKAMAEGAAAGKPLDKHRVSGKRKGPLVPLRMKGIETLEPLLDRGMVVLVPSVRGGRLRQVTAIEKVDAAASKFIGAISMPEYYPNMIKAFSDVVVHERTTQSIEFSWTLGFSVFGLTTRSRLTFAPDGMLWDGLSGDLGSAMWRWQVVPRGDKKCIVAYHGWANLNSSTYILEKSVKREPYLEHGLMAGSNMVMLRAVKRAVEGTKK